MKQDLRDSEPFREFTCYSNRGHEYARAFSEVDPGCTREEMRDHARREDRFLSIDLHGATTAELSVQFWGGHIGTSGQRVRVNGGDWKDLPQPRNTPGPPELYHRTLIGDHTLPLSLDELRHGKNRFQFTCGPQIKYDFGWGFYWIYSFTVRVFYAADLPHPQGVLAFPRSGEEITENPELSVAVDGSSRQVDFIGCYTDYDWEGDGVYRKWHYQFLDAVPLEHIGSACEPPWKGVWNTRWIPDQQQPMSLRARIRDETGMTVLSKAATGVRLPRAQRSVRLYTAESVPEKFGCRVGERKSCIIPMDGDPPEASACLLALSTWCGAHADEISLNGKRLAQRIGKVHDVSHDRLPVPPEILRSGENVFSIFSRTEHHAAEVNWPGPALLVEYLC
jgi:hypothetical protein